MHPFGGTPICPRCTKAVYAAEQIMGPGRKLYHKPCLACKNCGKRLDSFSLVEHNEEPYCKNCHVKLFGTRDLRHANLPHRDDLLGSPPASPVRPTSFGLNRAASPPPIGSRANSSGNGTAPPLPVRRHVTGGAALERTTSPPPTLLKPTRTLSPGREQRSRPTSLLQATEQMQQALRDVVEEEPERPVKDTEDEGEDWQPPVTPTHVGRSAGGLPRTIPLAPSAGAASQQSTPAPQGTPNANDADRGRRIVPLPLAPSMTGTRYGAALGGSVSVPLSPTMTGRAGGGSPWGAGGATPRCGRCAKPVYFAEQVKAVGKTWHKGCLRCAECGHSLDSGRLAEKEGEPFCQRCYAKRFGPQGSGYALLGKPGG
ncbi:LIM-domain-containing protein [Trametes coccinea BRFM310]|uniref:LIM-domain-containing protein n=1 Tax=Trametes coccinea (strain BRFM310) TaxID=1353009 RepID=A0A1Y2IH72_TRAC3|nr:LIM-domain-containing protein [Trametes coccinea BRFM310]